MQDDDLDLSSFFTDTKTTKAPARGFRVLQDDGDDPLEFLERSGFKRDRTVPDIKKPWMEQHEFEVVSSVDDVERIIDACIESGRCSLDLETEGLDNRINYRDGVPETVHKIVGYCISYDGHTGWYVPVRHRVLDGGADLNVYPTARVEAAITRLCRAAIPDGTEEARLADPLSYRCERPKVVIYFWNAQFDQEFLYPVTGIDWWHPESFEDGMLACFCINASDKQLSLKAKSKQLLKDALGNPYEMIELSELFYGKTKDIRFAALAPDEPGVKRYTGSDAICTFKLCELPEVVPLALKRHGYTYRIEKQTSNVLRIMERSRVRINREHVRQLLEQTEVERDLVLKRIRGFAAEYGVDLDPNSPKQLSEFLFGARPKGLDISPKPEKNEASGQFKTDGDTLEELSKLPHAPGILKDIVKYREVEKFIGTYLLGLSNNPDANNEIRVSFKQTGAASGRFSAPAGKPQHGYSGIPVHGIPGESDLRRDFEARDGYTMVKADYAGEELRIAANITGEKIWINEFLNGTGDLHSITARAFFGKQEVTKEERRAGKTANFALLYGGGAQAVVRATGCDLLEGKRRKAAFDKAVPTFAAWCKKQQARVKRDLGVWTPFGRWLAVPDARSTDPKVRAACERHATNLPIQGAGADIMKICLILLTKAFHRAGWLKNGGDDSVRMLLTVHDEVVFEIRHDRVTQVLPMIVDTMEYPWKIPTSPRWQVPLVVEPLVGFNWKSGYVVERAKEKRDIKPSEIDRVEQGIPLRRFEVLINGFVYSTTREPKKDKDTKAIVETLDRQEVIEGNVFRIIDPPWLAGVSLPPPPPPQEPPPESEPQAPSPSAVETRAIEVDPGMVPKFRVRLQLLMDPQIAAQVSEILEETRDERGMSPWLTDQSGCRTYLRPGRYVVNKDRFIARLRERNLVSARAAHEAQAT